MNFYVWIIKYTYVNTILIFRILLITVYLFSYILFFLSELKKSNKKYFTKKTYKQSNQRPTVIVVNF